MRNRESFGEVEITYDYCIKNLIKILKQAKKEGATFVGLIHHRRAQSDILNFYRTRTDDEIKEIKIAELELQLKTLKDEIN